MAAGWTRARLAAIAVGGAAGAALRWAVLVQWAPGAFPWPILVVNVAGSFVLGAIALHPSRRLLDLAGTGFCGGLTTFSTFAVEVARQVRDGNGSLALTYATASVAGATAAYLAGRATAQRRRR